MNGIAKNIWIADCLYPRNSAPYIILEENVYKPSIPARSLIMTIAMTDAGPRERKMNE